MSTATEARDGTEAAIDRLEEGEAVAALIAAQQRAAACVADAAEDILRAARAVAAALSSGGKLIYCGAGSSGLMALADALELPGTYGVGADRAFAIIAGGTAAGAIIAATTGTIIASQTAAITAWAVTTPPIGTTTTAAFPLVSSWTRCSIRTATG